MTRAAPASETDDVALERLEQAITARLETFLEGWLASPGSSSRAESDQAEPTTEEDQRKGDAAGAALVALIVAAATAAGTKAVADLGLKAAGSFKADEIGSAIAKLVGSSAAYEIAQARKALAAFDAGQARALARAERLNILKRWAAGIAVQAATATLNAGREHALQAVERVQDSIPVGIERTWTTRGDAKVRPAHAAVQGQKRPLGEPFDVAGVAMRYPGDTLAPPELAANCRCRLRYTLTKG